jgi:hypothetical protein
MAGRGHAEPVAGFAVRDLRERLDGCVLYSVDQGVRSVDREEVVKVAHAVVMQVNLVGDPGEGIKMLDEVVIPQAKAQPGFQRGTWMHSKAMTGTGVMVFDTEDHASAAMEALQPPAGGPTVINCAVFEIAREA